jgi:hypothetical protein
VPLNTEGPPVAGQAFELRQMPVVEMGGIEPPSDAVLKGLLRAQSASDFLGPSRRTDVRLIRAQPLKCPEHPHGLGVQQWPSKRRQKPEREQLRADGLCLTA